MLNKVCLIGRLGQDPEGSMTQAGDSVANFSVACSEKWKDKQGNRQEATEWVRVVVWKKLADICTQYLTKGRLVYIEGKLKTRKWTDKAGVDRYVTEVHAMTMLMLGDSGQAQEKPEPAAPPPVNDDDLPF